MLTRFTTFSLQKGLTYSSRLNSSKFVLRQCRAFTTANQSDSTGNKRIDFPYAWLNTRELI